MVEQKYTGPRMKPRLVRFCHLKKNHLKEFSKAKEEKSRVRSHGEGDQVHFRDRFRQEIDVYERLDPIVWRDFNLQRWWKAADIATLDNNGNSREPARFPLLSASPAWSIPLSTLAANSNWIS